MASALLHMNCAQLNNDSIIRMDGDFSGSRFGDIGVLKRDREGDERSQVKKRRKQSKPIRIASTESLSDPEGRLGDWNSREGQGSEAETGSYKSEPATPLNLSHNKDPALTEEESSWYRIPDNASCLYSFPPLRPTQSVYQNNVILPNQNSSSALVLPNFKRIFVGAGSDGQIASPHRIFNPEAFCDLCNKEFCNKYFLKTHKANKHGIYMENPVPNTVEMPPLPNNLNFFPNNLGSLPLPGSQINLKRMFPSVVPTNNAPKSSSSSMRAFCNICQREFCNKYFVRRHKAKIHGIVENPEEGSQDCHKPPSVKQDELTGPGPSNSQKDDPQEDDKPMRVKREQDMDSETADSPQNGLNYLMSSWQNDESKESCKSPESTQSRKQSGSGIFCDVCSKEFYSKHMLQVHKQKCHTSPSEPEDKSKSENTTSKTNQPMPLNLILRESKPMSDNDTSFPCTTCSMTFPEQYLLKLHFSIVHSNENKSPESLLQVYNSPYQPVLPENSNTASSEAPYSNSVESFQPKQQSQPPENSLDNSKLFNLDVQKLHSMIMKLNQNPHLENFMCDICNKEYGRSSNLENHIIKEHTALLEEIGNGFYEEGLNLQTQSKFHCSKCSTSFSTLVQLDHHLSEKHLFDRKLSGMRNGDETQDLSQSIGGERASLNTPTSSFCEICKKALCNKYFMKTHMQRMHGISIENGAHIGGVVCDICNKELCSKYFLRVHKQNSHGIVEEALLPQVGSDIKGQVSNTDVSLKPTENELTHRYFSHFTEVCTICSRRFRSVKWLKTHLLNDHGDEGKDKWRELQLQNGSKFGDRATELKKNDVFVNYKTDAKSSEPSTSYQGGDSLSGVLNQNATLLSKLYQCSYCSFSTSILALLYVHEKTHFPNSLESQDLRCPICMSPRETQESLEHHINTDHALNSFSKDDVNLSGHNALYERMENEDKDTSAIEDNNFTEVGFPRVTGEAFLKCQKCSFTIHRLDSYVEHMRREHCMDENGGGSSFQIVRDALLQMANASLVPASFAVPSTVGHFTMQPFVVEDKGNGSTFASSLVFLPVRERLNKPVTASFRLTPT